MEILIEVTWVLSNLCKSALSPCFIELILPSFRNQFYSFEIKPYIDQWDKIHINLCWMFYYLTNNSDNIDKLLKEEKVKILQILVDRLDIRNKISNEEVACSLPALYAIGNILEKDYGDGANSPKTVMLKAGLLLNLHSLLCNYYNCSEIVIGVLWIIYKIANDTDHIQRVIDASLLHPLIEILQFDILTYVEVVYIVFNMIKKGTGEHLIQLEQAGAIKAFCNLLKVENDLIIIHGLNGLINILQAAIKVDAIGKKDFAIMIINAGGSYKIKNLLYHKNERIYRKSQIINKALSPYLEDV